MANKAKEYGLESSFSKDASDFEGMDKAIAEGKSLIVNGSIAGQDGSLTPHFVYIAGKDSAGNYILGDPAQPETSTWSPEQLREFITRGADAGNSSGYAVVWKP
jgi:hypothetical protein